MDTIETIRAFNRFYASQIGLLGQVGLDGLAYTETRILYEIGAMDGATARALVQLFGLDEGYVSRLIKGLEARDLIARTPDPADRRKNLLCLTAEGRDAYDRLVSKARTKIAHMIADLPSPTRDQLLTALTTAQGILSWPDVADPHIREIGTGDLGWVIQRHGALYAASEGFDISFEALVARILADFIGSRQPHDMGWISTSNGVRLGCVFVVGEDERTARLRLMLVEPFARGKGVGQSLVTTAIKHARDHGFEKMVLWTEQGFDAACRLYARNRFVLTESKQEQMFGRTVVNQTWELRL